MEPWLIALIVILVLFFLIPAIIFTFAGFIFINTLKRSKNPNFNVKGVDVSFFLKGPMLQRIKDGLAYIETLTKEDVYLESYDHIKLHAYYFKNPYKETNKYFIGMHGFKSRALNEYSPYLKYYFDLGFNVILPDERAHGLSEGKFLYMGLKERYDVLSWANYIVNRFGHDTKILIEGVSMGGASVNLASNLDLPKEVIGIISDSAYANYKEEIKYQLSHSFKTPSFPILNILNMYLKMFLHVSFEDEAPVEAVKNSKVPMLFIHGKKDQMVPYKFSEELYEACGNKKKLVLVPEANHGESIHYLDQKYFDTIKEFFELD